ncbi:MAG: hypothetical protein R2729_28535 [Bryobacteraceae bacterium]
MPHSPHLSPRLLPGAMLVVMATGLAFPQAGPNPFSWGERTLLVVPMVGAGTSEDPRRPIVMPAPGQAPLAGVVSIRFEESDDGKTAIVEVVARDRKALQAALQPLANRADVKRFDRGRSQKEEIEAEFRGKKQGFDLDRFVHQGGEGRPDRAAPPGRN